MKVGIMQPYFFPYIGYFQLLNAVDEFIVYDNIEFSRKGWVNRNRILVNGKDDYITVTLKKDSDYLDIVDRRLSDTWSTDRVKLLNRIKESYRRAPMFGEVYPWLESSIPDHSNNLFEFLLATLRQTMTYLQIKTPLVISSVVPIDHSLKSQERVIALVRSRNAETYFNPIGGLELYNKDEFRGKGIELKFLKANSISYTQFSNEFVPSLSIIDVMMFNPKERIASFLNEYTLQ